MRSMCRTIEATKTSAAQWCVCRISKPARTLNERSTGERQLRQRPSRGAEDHLRAAGGVEGRVVAGADQRRARLDDREGRLAEERDCTTGVGADLRVRNDAARRPVAALSGQVQLRGLEADDDERRAEQLLVCPLRVGGVEGLLHDLVEQQRFTVLIDESRPSAPGRLVEPAGVEQRTDRERGHDERGTDRSGRRPGPCQKQALARKAVTALLDELLELLLRGRMREWVVLLELLGHDQPFADDDQRRGAGS